ncbi:MAG: O-antigen ligase family protein [Bacteroidota bacterium]|nr:O-antigen ligase family protein [Bacteroidota bacterium]
MQIFTKQNIIDTILVLLLVSSTGGLLFVYNRNLCYFIFLGVLLGGIIFGKRPNRFLFNASLYTYLGVLLLLIINYYYAPSLQSLNKYGYYIMVISVSILFLFYFLNNRNYDRLLNRLYVVLKYIMIHAFLNFIAFFFIKNNLNTIISTHHECQTYHNIFFYGSILKEYKLVNIFGLEFCRNQGIFWEPGVLQVFLNIFFFIEAFILKQNRKLLILTAFVILTTYSTTGIALLLIQTVIFIFREFKRNQLIFSILLLISIPIYTIFNINMQEKLSGNKKASYMKRVYDFVQPLYIASEHPLTGVGLDIEKFQEIRQEYYFSPENIQQIGIDYKYDEKNQKNTNSISFLFAAMGFPTALLLLYMFIKQRIFKEDKWLFLLIMLISAISEPLFLRPFFFIFVVSGFLFSFYRIRSKKQA